MSIYIVRPKTTMLGRFPNLATRKLSATSREEQVKEVAALWEENQTYQEIREWVQDTPEAHKINLLPNPDSPEITGTTLVEMSEETAAQMGQELPNADILSNQPIELIQPQRQQDTHKHELPSLVAPGEGVYSCVMGGGYEAWSCTSMATPIVSGVAATILEEYPEITIGDIREELLSRCKDLGQPIERQGAGIIQIQT